MTPQSSARKPKSQAHETALRSKVEIPPPDEQMVTIRIENQRIGGISQRRGRAIENKSGRTDIVASNRRSAAAIAVAITQKFDVRSADGRRESDDVELRRWNSIKALLLDAVIE